MDKIKGFARISVHAFPHSKTPDDYTGKVCPVIEFSPNGSIVVMNPVGVGVAIIEAEDYIQYFRCGYSEGVITPPDLLAVNEMSYIAKAHQRIGGYDVNVKNLVMAVSLSKGEFTDAMLWQK